MARKEKNTKKTLLWLGLGILGAGVLAFGGAFAFGALLLARDLLYLALFVDTLIVGGALGKVAVDSIADKVASKQQTKTLSRERDRENELVKEEKQSKEDVFQLGEKVTVEDIGKLVEKIGDHDVEIDDREITFEFDEEEKKEVKEVKKSVRK